MKTILYIHGMGGGADSRIPRILRQSFGHTDIRCIVRTYDFDPERGHAQIASWVDELRPDLVIGESLGAAHALRIRGVPQLFVSPALGGPDRIVRMAGLARTSLGRALLRKIWHAKKGDRQPIRFEHDLMLKYGPHWEEARKVAAEGGYHFAFFGTRDHYLKWGVVSIDTWREMFGDTFQLYEGSHFMEEEYIHSLLIPKIREVLGNPALCK